MVTANLPPLLTLSSELMHHILGYLTLSELLNVSLVNHSFNQHTLEDSLWRPFVQEQVPEVLPKSVELSWRKLYIQHHPYWFLVKKKIWFSDAAHTGKLVLARYNLRLNAIEAYGLVAERLPATFQTWEYDPDAVIHSFNPKIQLDQGAAVIRLDAEAYAGAHGEVGYRLQKEITMDVPYKLSPSSARLYSRLMLAREWPRDMTTAATPVWPPMILPSSVRTRNDSPPSAFRLHFHKPATLGELSTSSFRMRKWMEFVPRYPGITMRAGEEITTWATLPEECYTPTPQKPWQGIWCGDYVGHGCEFLVIMQPDDPRPLPEHAELAMRAHERDGSVSNDGSCSTAPTDVVFSSDEDEDQDDSVYRGRIEAVKLTGDPNIPRGEYAFIAPDIGPNGLLRVASDDMFGGARIIKSVGHIASRGFRDDTYSPSELILVSHDRLAQYWKIFGYVSFYQRVNLNDFTHVEEEL